jgi:subtilisin family serine protease
MKYGTSAFAALSLLTLGACADAPTAVAPSVVARAAVAPTDQDTPRHVVMFRGGAIPADFSARVAAAGGTVLDSHSASGVAVVTGLSQSAAASLAGAEDVQSVSRDLEITLEAPTREADLEADSEAGAAAADATAGARFLARQWSYKAIGADRLAASSIPDREGSASVRVAILDTGIDPLHPDLAGLVDASRSASFVPGDAAIVAEHFPGRPAWTDLNGHGSHVASTVSSNAVIGRGVTSKTTLMAVKVLGARGSSFGSSVFQGITFAADNGADVINMSLGGSFDRVLASARGGDGPSFLALINRAVHYASKRGVLLVVSAGNSAIDLDSDKNGYKSYCSAPNVVCTSATGPTDSYGPTYATWTDDIDAPAIYSNYGRSAITIAAPGGNYSFAAGNVGAYVWQACSTSRLTFSTVTQRYTKHVCATTAPRLAGYVGTSMASPHASGLAALLVQRVGKGNVAQLSAAMVKSAADLGTPGVDKHYGKGRIDVAKAMGM